MAVAPLTVLADPARLGGILDGGTAGLHPSAAYIFRKQHEEADIVAISKADLLTVAERAELKARLARACPAATVCALSAKTGEGLDEWLDEVLNGSGAGRHLAEVDYDVYAEGEAVLGWLNATVRLSGREGVDWAKVCRSVLAGLQADLRELNAAGQNLRLQSCFKKYNKYMVASLGGRCRLPGAGGARRIRRRQAGRSLSPMRGRAEWLCHCRRYLRACSSKWFRPVRPYRRSGKPPLARRTPARG